LGKSQSLYLKPKHTMESSNTLTIIKESFEAWYNKHLAKELPATIVINYRDTQTLAIRAYHTSSIEMQAVSIKDCKSFIVPLLKLSENYNHGIITEEEAKDNMLKKLLIKLYSFK